MKWLGRCVYTPIDSGLSTKKRRPIVLLSVSHPRVPAVYPEFAAANVAFSFSLGHEMIHEQLSFTANFEFPEGGKRLD